MSNLESETIEQKNKNYHDKAHDFRHGVAGESVSNHGKGNNT